MKTLLTRAGGAGWQRSTGRSGRGGPQLVRNQGQWLRQGTHWGWGRRFGEKRAVAHDAQEELRTVDERESHAGEKNHKHCIHTHTYDKHHTRRHKRCEDEEVWEVWGGRAGASAHDGHEYRTCTSTSAIQEPACRGDGGACKGRRGGRTRARYSVGRVGGRGKKRAAGKAEEKKEKTFDSRLALERRVGTYQVLVGTYSTEGLPTCTRKNCKANCKL